MLPSASFAQQNCEKARSNRVIGTVAGAGVGGVLGNVIAGKGDKTLGTVIGAVVGGVAGNQIAKPSGSCARAYGYYDKDGRWHATGVNSRDASGYYDRDENWVEGQPAGGRYDDDGTFIAPNTDGYYDRNDVWVARATTNTRREDAYGYYDDRGMWHAATVNRGSASGYYDRNDRWVEGTPNGHYDAQGRWIAHNGDATSSGSYDAKGRWIPASAGGYYDANKNWVAGSASGYYNSRGRWIAGPTVGRYDARGRWIAGSAAGRRDSNGNWIADPQPGYYNSNGRWIAGTATGYYDNRGRWINTGITSGVGSDQSGLGPIPRVVRARLTWMDQYIRASNSQGTLSRVETNRSLRELAGIRNSERAMIRDRRGELSVRNEAAINIRLDRLSDKLRISGDMSRAN